MKELSVIELFSGIGSQRSALDRISIDYPEFKHSVVGIAEIDKHAIKSYEAIHGATRNYGDISKIERLDYADLWTYSFPCTDISLAGKQKGLQHANKGEEGLLGMLFEDSDKEVVGTRSGLLYEVQRLLWVAKENGSLPKFLLLENVKALVGKKFMSDFQSWLDELDMLGYNSYWKVLNAKDYGIPQNRERVFVVSVRKDVDNRKFKWPMRFPLQLRLKDLLEDKVDEKYYLKKEQLMNFILKGNTNPSGNGMNGKVHSEDEVAPTLTTNKGEGIKIIGSLNNTRHEQTNRVYGDDGISPTINTMQGGNLQPKIAVKEYATYISWEDSKGRINTQDHRAFKSDSVSGTVPAMERGVPKIAIPEATKQGYALAGDGGGVYLNRPHQKRGVVQDGMIQTIKTSANDIGVVDGMRIRKLTPRECWKLMDFTDEQFDRAAKVCSNSQLYKQAGNSIVINVLYHIFKSLFIESEIVW